MARILIGWELGAGTGHAVKLAATARLLVARGHQPVFAGQQIGALEAIAETWQAPLWPSLITTLARRSPTTPATMGDILAILGLADENAMSAMLLAWDRIVTAVKPDAIAAEFAPGLTMAMRGRVPTVALGTGFSLPPSHLAQFPSLTGKPSVFAENMLLDRINAALARAGRDRLAALPETFAADLRIPAAFRELDPYRAWRLDVPAAPSLSSSMPPLAGAGDELFVYINGVRVLSDAFWQGVAGAAVPTRVYAPYLGAADRATLERAGLAVEERQVPFDRIAERSRLVMSHGGMGFVSSALLAGLPQVIVSFDIEKRMIAASVEEIGLGVRQELTAVEARPFAALIRKAYEDAALTGRARRAAPDFRARATQSSEADAVAAVEALLALG